MNRRTEHERLFSDALAEDAPAEFREALLGETLRHVRRRRRWRRTRHGVLVVALVSLLAFLARPNLRRHPSATPLAAGCPTVRTQPLPAGAIVATESLSPGRLVASLATVNVTRTTLGAGDYHEIGDAELLALVAPRPAALVGCGPQCKQLIFLNPEDENGFPVN
jgi:hypothetical protein